MNCKKCGKDFHYEVHHMNVPGGKDREYIFCPYCKETKDSVVTDGWVSIYTAEEYEARNKVLNKPLKLKDAKSGIELRTLEEKAAIDAMVRSAIPDGTLRNVFLNSAYIDAFANLLIDKGVLTREEISEGFFDAVEVNIKKLVAELNKI